jgi:hypothetical protein
MPQVESYFKAQGTLRSPYYIGLRSFAAGPVSPYPGFTWRDGPNAFYPSDVPSGSVEQVLGAYNEYSHWGGNSSTIEPDDSLFPGGNCVVVDETYFSPYWYYDGYNTTAGRQDLNNYIDSANATLNLWAWRRVGPLAAACLLLLLLRHACPLTYLWTLCLLHPVCGYHMYLPAPLLVLHYQFAAE